MFTIMSASKVKGSLRLGSEGHFLGWGTDGSGESRGSLRHYVECSGWRRRNNMMPVFFKVSNQLEMFYRMVLKISFNRVVTLVSL